MFRSLGLDPNAILRSWNASIPPSPIFVHVNPVPHLVTPGSASGPTHGAAINPAVEAILRRDPAGAYDRSDPRTQWQYRAALAQWERRTGLGRRVLARGALLRAEATKETDGADAPGAHIGYHLLGAGARGLAPELLFPLAITLASVLAVTCTIYVHRSAAPVWAQVLVAISAVPLASVYASSLARSLPWRRRPNLPLPRLRPGRRPGER
ncbi:MAG: hypothetical protein JWM27_487 [Gemmatimonadetes bacterium]|nr:hypothetical protein [Gemmatimonadota bacterium]